MDRRDGMTPSRTVAVFQADPHRPGRALELAQFCCTALNDADTSWHPSMGVPEVKPSPQEKATPATPTAPKVKTKRKPWSAGKPLPLDWDTMKGMEKAAFLAGLTRKSEQGDLLEGTSCD